MKFLQPLTLSLAPVLSAPVRRRALRVALPVAPEVVGHEAGVGVTT